MSQYTAYDISLAEAMVACTGDCCNKAEGSANDDCLECKQFQVTCFGEWEDRDYKCPRFER